MSDAKGLNVKIEETLEVEGGNEPALLFSSICFF